MSSPKASLTLPLNEWLTGAEIDVCLESLYDLLKASRNNKPKQETICACIRKLEKRLVGG